MQEYRLWIHSRFDLSNKAPLFNDFALVVADLSSTVGGFRCSVQRLEEYPAELLARQLPNRPPHLQIKERSQNPRRVQARSFHDLITVSLRLVYPLVRQG